MCSKMPLMISDFKQIAKSKIIEQVKQYQDLYNKNNVEVKFIINHSDLETAFVSAEETLGFHGITDEKVNHTKKIAHLAFWITKLKPISTIKSDVLYIDIVKSYISPSTLKTLKGKLFKDEAEKKEEIISQIHINEKIALSIFIGLYMANKRITKEEIQDKVREILVKEETVETVKSLRYHNYSARSMATMLEYFIGNFFTSP